MANEQNLIPNNERSPNEVRENGRKGGKASAKKRQQNKTFKELCNQFANNIITNEKLKKQLVELGITDNEVSNKMAMVVALWKEAIKGNTRAFELYRDTIGEKPIEKTEISGTGIVQLVDDVNE